MFFLNILSPSTVLPLTKMTNHNLNRLGTDTKVRLDIPHQNGYPGQQLLADDVLSPKTHLKISLNCVFLVGVHKPIVVSDSVFNTLRRNVRKWSAGET